MFGWFRRSRRRRLTAAGLPPEWSTLLREHVWQYEGLSAEERKRLDAWVCVFVAERHWEGCNGLQVTDAMRVSVAGQAGLIVLGHDDWYFDRTPSILIYPDDYVARDVARPAGGGLTIVGDEERLGEAWYRGPVILSWSDVIEGGRGGNQGRNLVFHEFAHQLDMIGDPAADGEPPMPDAETQEYWRRVVPAEFERLRRECAGGTPRLLDCYGATSPAEFFAVASETYFQRPAAMRVRHPELYKALQRFYRVDPERWLS